MCFAFPGIRFVIPGLLMNVLFPRRLCKTLAEAPGQLLKANSQMGSALSPYVDNL